MKISFKASLKTIKRIPAYLFNIGVEKSFALFLIFVLVDLFIGAGLFYYYTFFAETNIQGIEARSFNLDENLLREIVERLEEKEKLSKKNEFKTYSDLFRPREQIEIYIESEIEKDAGEAIETEQEIELEPENENNN